MAAPRIAFFSRGKGRGHAIPDAAIAAALRAINPEIGIALYSYSTGLETLRGLGWDAIDLKLPENNPLWETAIVVSKCLANSRPTLVVSHEEFTVPPLARAAALPSVFITDWFAPPDTTIMQGLQYADEILMLDDPGFQDVPSYLSDRVTFVGSVLREWPRPMPSRQEARQLLGVSDNALVVLGVPGGAEAHSELVAPVYPLLLKAFGRLRASAKTLIWVAGEKELSRLRARFEGTGDVRFMLPHESIVQTMMAADVVVTKGNRITVLECEALGIPSISISLGLNPVDDQRIARVASNVGLRGRGLRVEDLIAHLTMAARRSSGARTAVRDLKPSGSITAVVKRIAQRLASNGNQ